MLRILTDADKQDLGQHRALPCARAYHCALYGPGATTTDGGCVPVLCPISSLASTDAFMQSMASKSRFHASHLLPVLDSCALRRDETYVRALICSPAPPRPTVQAQLCSITTSVQRTRVIDRSGASTRRIRDRLWWNFRAWRGSRQLQSSTGA